jgi:ATP-binding cassette, subfamily B, bacterial
VRLSLPAPLQSQTLAQLGRLLSFLPKKRLQGLIALLAVSLLVGLFDLVFVGLLARLVGALSGVKLQDRIPQIWFFGGGRASQSLWMVGILIGLIWISTGLKFLTAALQSFLSAQIWADYGNRIYANILMQDFEYFQTQKSAHLLARLNRILGKISDDIILPLLTVVSSSLSVGILTIGVAVVLGPIAIVLFATLLTAYASVSALLIPPLRLASKQKLRFALRINTLLMESIRSIRDVQLYAAEQRFIDKFWSIGITGKRYDRIAKLLPDIPRYIIEPAGITILFAIGLLPILLDRDRKLQQALPALAAVMFAALKISAPIQSIFRSVNRFRGSLPDISDALQLLDLKSSRATLQSPGTPSPAGVMPKNTIKLTDVWFRYASSEDWVIKGVSLTIPIGSRVALVGKTGGGKTTTAHLLLALFKPQRGSLQLDGIELAYEEVPAWQACCAMVPQAIVLLDTSIRENVAFGVDEADINDYAVWEALESAQLNEFVSELPYGLYTMIGENGLRLSGGQRQRLALARAFYKNAKVLVLDEATSSLDNKTESSVLDSLELIGRRCTTIVIAHRLSTVKHCDRIYEFADGMIRAHGDYHQLQTRSETFRELVSLDNG